MALDRLYLHVFDGWMTAIGIDIASTVDQQPANTLSDARVEALKGGNINLLQGTSTDTADRAADDEQHPGQQAGPP